MLALRSLLLFFLLSLAGCMVGPNFRKPAPPCATHYTEKPLPARTASTSGLKNGGSSQQFMQNRDIPAEWWQLFHSEELNQLMQQGIRNNPTLKAAEATLREAEDTLRAQIGLLLLPSVTGQFNGQRQRFSGVSIGNSAESSLFTLYNTSVDVSYILDVWGGQRRQVEYYRAQVDYEHYEYLAAYLTLTANIATTAINIASFDAQIRATQALLKEQTKEWKILKQQLNLGAISQQSVLTQETKVAETRATLPPLEKSLSQSRHALAVLVGCLPSDTHIPQIHLENLILPKMIPVSLPSALVSQRPDVGEAEALLHAASAQVGVATANLLPQINLTGSWGYQTTTLSSLINNKNNFWNYGGQLMQPIFKGGALWAQRKAAIDAYEVAAQQYRQTVLQAFQNVADSLRAIETDARTLKASKEAEVAARANLELASQQLRLGAINYLVLLVAEDQYQQTLINRVQAQSLRYADTVALFQSLGGGWWNIPHCSAPTSRSSLR